MRVEAAVCCHVVELDGISILNEVGRVDGIPSIRAIDWLAVDVERLGHVLHEPQVVFILMRVEGDLLLLAAGGVHKVVRVQISSLGVVMPDGDSASKCNIDRNILHSF